MQIIRASLIIYFTFSLIFLPKASAIDLENATCLMPNNGAVIDCSNIPLNNVVPGTEDLSDFGEIVINSDNKIPYFRSNKNLPHYNISGDTTKSEIKAFYIRQIEIEHEISQPDYVPGPIYKSKCSKMVNDKIVDCTEGTASSDKDSESRE